MSKTLETRIQNKIDTEANWKTSDLIPLSGELIIYDVDDTHSQPRIKFGDGVTVADKLPFTRTPGNYWTPDLRPAPYLYLKCNNTTTPDEVTRLYEDIDSSDDAQEPEDPEEVIKQPLTVPTANITTFTYNGISQGPGWVYDTTLVTMSGTATATNAGTYTTTFSIKDKEKYYWEDTNDTTDKKLEWTINKDTHNVATPVSVKVWDIEPTHFNAYSDVLGDPTYAQSEDTSIATVSVDTSALTNNVTVNFVSEGDTTITLVWEDPNYVTVTRTVAVTCAVKQFRDYTWAEIAELSQNDALPDTWEVGNEKTIECTDGTSLTAMIIGFDHDTDSSGLCPITLQIINGPEAVNRTGSWSNIVAVLPSDIRDNLRTVGNKTWSGGSATGWLLSAVEVLGSGTILNSWPKLREEEGAYYYNRYIDDLVVTLNHYDEVTSEYIHASAGKQYERYEASNWLDNMWLRSNVTKEGSYLGTSRPVAPTSYTGPAFTGANSDEQHDVGHVYTQYSNEAGGGPTEYTATKHDNYAFCI